MANRLRGAARIARSEYIRLERELRRNGLDAKVIRANARTLTERRDGTWYVREQAYAPTGVALGCPLDRGTTAHLRRLTDLIDQAIARIAQRRGPALALVPPAATHITVANRAHYEHSAPAFIGAEEFDVIRECVRRAGIGAVEVSAFGLMLTAHGKLFLKCMPIDDRLLELRTRLVEALPALAINLPVTAHIKLAHLRIALTTDQTGAVQTLLHHLDDHVLARHVFRDVYTPHGRVPL